MFCLPYCSSRNSLGNDHLLFVNAAMSVTEGTSDGSVNRQFFLNSGSAKRSRNRQERVLRYVLRRKPCYIFFFVQCIVYLFLSVLGVSFFSSIRSFVDRKMFLEEQDRLFEERKDQATLLHCEYDRFDFFEMDGCTRNCGPEAIFYRISKLSAASQNDPTCFDKIESFPCHSKNYCAKPSSYSGLDERGHWVCIGKGYAAMTNDLLSPTTTVFFPKLNVSSIPLGSLTIANQLFGKCPRCQVATSWKKDSKLMRCSRRVVTVNDGWPTDFEKCNHVDMGSCE
ncbi:hypothetical protein QR680_016543 [Steinernema hermaphroditum]|uniref:Uncharacterized protein n=1 Tax=Steinernema hermaphroditum TaxID=289476 RepID=A0AA39HBJ0_9BILA|nr:hypothetical protein QR680_016543 [Steinernema hermaphroditum]